MRWNSIVLLLLILLSCDSKSKPRENDLVQNKDSVTSSDSLTHPDPNSRCNAVVDTSTLEGKIEHMKNWVMCEAGTSDTDHDTLLDFNYDGHKDLLVTYYALSGTFVKYNTYVCIFDPSKNDFYSNEDLRYPNASFFMEEKKFTCHYGPDANEYRWINGEWKLMMEADYNWGTDSWTMNYTDGRKSKVVNHPGVDDIPDEVIEIDRSFYSRM